MSFVISAANAQATQGLGGVGQFEDPNFPYPNMPMQTQVPLMMKNKKENMESNKLIKNMEDYEEKKTKQHKP